MPARRGFVFGAGAGLIAAAAAAGNYHDVAGNTSHDLFVDLLGVR
jgi:hypothetical protein